MVSAYVSPSSSCPNRSGIGDVSATVRTQSLDCPVGVAVAITVCRSAVSHNKSRPEDAVEDVPSFTGVSASSCSIALFFDFVLLPLLSYFFPREFGDEDASGGACSEGSAVVTQDKLVGGVDLFSSTEAQ